MLYNIHKLSYNNKQEIGLSKFAGCFHCLNKFPANEVKSFRSDKHAVCPKCGKDTVIGDKVIKGKFILPFILDKKLFVQLNEEYDTTFGLLS